MTEIELEKTYLAASLPDLTNAPSHIIRDIYVPKSVDHASLRLRQKDGSYVITKKEPVSGLDSTKQYEHTIQLTKDEFEALASCSAKKVAKRRYMLDIEGHPAELDVFLDDLEGLVLIDFEFGTEADMAAFTSPALCLADVSQEAFVAGGKLAGKSYRDIEEDLLRYNYKPLTTEEK